MKTVRFTGSRVARMRVHILIEGQQVNSRGYISGGKGTTLDLTDKEADVLTGKLPPVVTDNGKIVTGFYIAGDLGEAGLTGEKWEEVNEDASTSETLETKSEPVASSGIAGRRKREEVASADPASA